MIGCGLAIKTAHMTDGEFWDFVFRDDEPMPEPDPEDCPMPFMLGPCLRCGEDMRLDDYEAYAELADQDVRFCDDCTTDMGDHDD
jgi:hypothetical protein